MTRASALGVLVVLALLLFGINAPAQTGGSAGSAGAPPVVTGGGGPPSVEGERGSTSPKLSTSFQLKPTDVVRGATLTVTGGNLMNGGQNPRLWLDDLEIATRPQVDPNGKSFTFVIPDTGRFENDERPIVARRYVVRMSQAGDAQNPADDAPKVTLGVVRVVSEKQPPLSLETVYPTILYPDTQRIVLTGAGFGGRLHDYALLIDGVELSLCPDGIPRCGDSLAEAKDDCCHGLAARFTSDHQLEVDGVPDGEDKSAWRFKGPRGTNLEGEHLLAVRSGDATTRETVKVAFSAWKSDTVRLVALAFSGVLLLGLVLLAVLGGGKHRVGSQTLAWGTFLLDAETDTYSLAKVQAYAWTATTLIGYSYLALSRTLVQGKLDLVDVPPNLTGILSISLGTAVASAGITKMRGPKASGSLQPSIGDLIKVGGVVSPERAFFLLWTVVAIATFILNVLKIDPMVLSDLPKVPDSLLALSGISAAGYLGGKAVRGAGPVVDEALLRPLDTQANPANWQLTVLGRYLDVDATLEVDGKPITPLMASSATNMRAEVVTPDEDTPDRFAKGLRIKLASLPASWMVDGKEPGQAVGKLTVANSDGQRSTVEVTL